MAIKSKGKTPTKSSNGNGAGKGHSEGNYDDSNRLVLFPNPRKEKGDSRPDFTGRVNVDGDERWLSVWRRETQDGRKYLSGSVNDPVEERAGGKKKAASTEDDDIPF